jgi:hypothetical protein
MAKFKFGDRVKVYGYPNPARVLDVAGPIVTVMVIQPGLPVVNHFTAEVTPFPAPADETPEPEPSPAPENAAAPTPARKAAPRKPARKAKTTAPAPSPVL